MTFYSVQPRDCVFVKGYEFLSFPKNLIRNIVKNISKNVSSNYSQNHLDHTKKTASDALKLIQKEQFKGQLVI